MRTQQTQNICITFAQRQPNVSDVGPTLYKSYTNVLCLLGTARLPRTFLIIIKKILYFEYNKCQI